MPTALLAPVLSSALAAALLLMTGCGGFHAGYVSAGGAPAATARDIDQAYAERDACLARNATERALAGAVERGSILDERQSAAATQHVARRTLPLVPALLAARVE